ncbi:MAG: hypothetical protein M1380_09710 [Chloroflexi bacterium]|nr:hypothetical protein [Chloroflexota bacterium]MCL5026202.1 hypothetical protein [Chloroflexota bacterium]
MRITDVKAAVVRTDVPFDLREPSQGTMEANLVQVFTDAGIRGDYLAWEGRTTGRGLADTIVTVLKPFLVGKDPLDRELIFDTLVSWNIKGIPMVGTGAIDVCLWDIAGKALGVPVYKLMGGYRDKVRVYASTTVLPRPADYADLARRLKAQGYTAMKLHVRGVAK